MPKKPIKMKVIQNLGADTPGVLRPLFSDRPVLTGPGDDSYVCGACGIVLLQGVSENRGREFALRCAGCGSYNAVETSRYSPPRND